MKGVATFLATLFLSCAQAPLRPTEKPSTCPGVSVGVRPLDLGLSLRADDRGSNAELRRLLNERVPAIAETIQILVSDDRAEGFEDITGAASCYLPLRDAIVVGRPPRLLVPTSGDVQLARNALALKQFDRGHWPEARMHLVAAQRLSDWPTPHTSLLLTKSLLNEGRQDEALARLATMTQDHPWYAPAFTYQGELLFQRRRPREAIVSLAHALAIWPDDETARAVLARITIAESVPPIAPPARRRATGAEVIWWTSPQAGIPDRILRAEARAYGACKESFRRVRALRELAAGEELPLWRWSPAEESLCTGFWLSVYQAHRVQGRPAFAPAEDALDILRAGYLTERGIFDVGARAFPGAPMLLSDEARARLVAFVSAHRVRARSGAGALFR